jgi:hypothetical protein
VRARALRSGRRGVFGAVKRRRALARARASRSTKLAAAGADRVVHLYDEAGERRDKFRTKAADSNASGAYLVRGLAFSPDSAKLAVAQSDSVVFVYRWGGEPRLGDSAGLRQGWWPGAAATGARRRGEGGVAPSRRATREPGGARRRGARPHRCTRRLGAGWDEKKSICNKFAQGAPVTCLAWPAERHGDVCFGLSDGKVKLGVLKTNKTYTLCTHPAGSPVAALAASPDGRALASGHADGSVYVFTFPEQQARRWRGGAQLGGSCRKTVVRTKPRGQLPRRRGIHPPVRACGGPLPPELARTALEGRLAAPSSRTTAARRVCWRGARASWRLARTAGCAAFTRCAVYGLAPACAQACRSVAKPILAASKRLPSPHVAQVVLYDPKSGREQQAFDYSGDDGARSFGCAAVNPAGDAMVVGGYNRLYVFAQDEAKGGWQAAEVKQARPRPTPQEPESPLGTGLQAAIACRRLHRP